MRKLVLLLALCCIRVLAFSQYWQQQIIYLIDVSLNDKEKTLDAFEKITYINNSPDTLTYIWFHLWANAYKNDRTAFSDQLLENGNTNFYFSNKEQKGYINRLDFKVDGITAKTEDHPQFIDVVKLLLPTPLAPKHQITITTPFHEKLPFNYSRGGYDKESFQITQWYPKPAVYDRKGWHPMPYLDQGEFYSEFGNFNVRITVPKNYVVAATGELQDSNEKRWLKTKTIVTPVNKPQQPVKPSAIHQKVNVRAIPSATETKTLTYLQNNVHDFAWFADKEFIVNSDTCVLKSGRTIEVFSYYTPSQQLIWKNSVQFAKDAIRFYSNEVGEYPFNTVSVVQGPASFGGGMEYPTITIISPVSTEDGLDEVIAHELGHNWFYGILATNERDHPWMDEGINSFYEYKYIQGKYGPQTQENKLLFQTKALRNIDQPIETPSSLFSESNYGLVVYYKAAEWLKIIETKLGDTGFRNMMHDYLNQWEFKHPYPEDFKSIVQTKLGIETDTIFSLLNTKGILPGQKLTGFKLVSPFIKGSINGFLQNPVKNSLFISPVIGANSYDKFMLGILFSNYNLPPNRFQYLAIPMYAFGSKSFTGLGKLNYTFQSKGLISRTDIFLNGSTFSMDDFTDTTNHRLIMRFQKLVPGVKFTFREKNPKTTVSKYIQWKTFLINEQSLNFVSDTVINGSDTALVTQYLLPKQNRYLNQLQFVYENYRALYPYNFNFQIEQAKDFIRPTLTANYYFNYSDKGGLQVRFFAGKFIYLNGKTIEKEFHNDRYFLNMTGANGFEDYTYSDYFVGRNKFEGLASQQIMTRDGGFKVRTELLANKVGKTDNWLSALNFNSTVPDKINPLSVLPIKIPLHVFMDIGTYAEAWDKNSDNDHFLYDIGFHIPLLDGVVNVYIPIVYNKVYSDYYKSTYSKNRFLKAISFSIDLYNKDIKKLNQEIQF